MAKRPVFVPNVNGKRLVSAFFFDFSWAAGLSTSQKRKNIRSLHEVAARQRGLARVLEISSKSEHPLGVALSAFNLTLAAPDGTRSFVENFFQASKVFAGGGPFTDLLSVSPADAKRDPRLRNSGALRCFRFAGLDWPLQPTTAFYDWLYITALQQNPELARQLVEFDGFTDIEFNPERSLNCQAASAATYVALVRTGRLEMAMASRDAFLRAVA